MARIQLDYDSISVNGFNALDSAINYLDTVINYLQQNSIPSDFYRYNTLINTIADLKKQLESKMSDDDKQKQAAADTQKLIEDLQKQLAERCGMTQANISNIEKGITKPTIDSLKKIADATGKRLIIEFVDREGMF